jgi:hypothetical protein
MRITIFNEKFLFIDKIVCILTQKFYIFALDPKTLPALLNRQVADRRTALAVAAKIGGDKHQVMTSSDRNAQHHAAMLGTHQAANAGDGQSGSGEDGGASGSASDNQENDMDEDVAGESADEETESGQLGD